MKSFRWHWLLWTAVFIFLLIVIFQPIHIHTYSRTIIDDGYYYLGYANSITTGQGATFDGLVETNGVQPLWTLILIVLAIISPDRVSLVYVMLITSAVLVLASIIFVNRILRSIVSDHARWITLLTYTAFVINPQMSLTGMETALNLFTLTATLATIWNLPGRDELRVRHLLMTGVLIGLVCLSRLDNLIITPVLALLMLWRTGLWNAFWQEQQWRRALVAIGWLAIPALIIFAIYIAFNQITFGRLLPISGEVKSAWLERELAAQGIERFSPTYLYKTTLYAVQHYLLAFNYYFWLLLATYGPLTSRIRMIVVILLAVGTLAFVLYRLRKPKYGSPKRLNLSAARITLVILLLSGIFLHTWVMYFQLGATNVQQWMWYFVPEYLTVAFLLAYCVEGLLRWQPPAQAVMRVIYAIMGLFMLVGATSYLVELRNKPFISPLNMLYEAALWSNENLPDDAVGGAFNAGVVGYFTDMRVINLDGLMNGDGILQVARGEQSIWDYVQSEPITYIMDYLPEWESIDSTFRDIPAERLELLYSKDFIDWGGVESTYYIFQLLPT
jgi:hypothetical protein